MKRGRIHEYLGMTLDYTKKGEVQVSTIPYIKNIINEFSEEITSSASKPTSDHLFQVQGNGALLLPEEQAIIFHHTIAQLLFVSAWVRQDIQTPFAFLTA